MGKSLIQFIRDTLKLPGYNEPKLAAYSCHIDASWHDFCVNITNMLSQWENTGVVTYTEVTDEFIRLTFDKDVYGAYNEFLAAKRYFQTSTGQFDVYMDIS
jgi:hypothetical protein